MDNRQRDLETVAVVGAGAAGIATAYYLTRLGHRVELFEAGTRLGGNCRRISVPCADGGETEIDMGVSDFNRVTFRRFTEFVTELGVEVRPICEDATALFADGTTAWSCQGGRVSHAGGAAETARLEAEIKRFVSATPELLEISGSVRLGEYLRRNGYSDEFGTLYARPRAAGCIVMPSGDPDDHDMRSLVRFWHAHGLVGTQPRQRMHVVGGMWSYCDAFAEWFCVCGGVLHLGARARHITRGLDGARIVYERDDGEGVCVADHVVVAVDASRLAGMIADADTDEQMALDSVRYEHAEVVIHEDPRLMPRDRAAWGAYQFYVARPRDRFRGPSITFYPHRLARLREAEGVFVTLNPPITPRDELVLARHELVHPIANPTASRPDLFARVQGRSNTWYAGSYLQAPWLHEQAFASGAWAAEAISRRAKFMLAASTAPVELITGSNDAKPQVLQRPRASSPASTEVDAHELVVPRLQPPYTAAVHARVVDVERTSIQWLRSVGLGATPREVALLERGGFARLAARAYPYAPTPVLQVITDFVTWAFMFDESCEQNPDGDRAAIDRRCRGVIAICVGYLFGGADPLLRAFIELRRRIIELLGAACPAFFADLIDFIEAVQAQLELAGTRPSFDAELRTREVTIGLYPCLHFIAPAASLHVPAAMRNDAEVIARDRLAAQALCWTNDLVSIKKELRDGEPHNLVLALQAQRDSSLQSAVDEAVGRYYRTLAAFAEQDARCRTDDPASIAYSDGLRAWIAALPAWSYASARYAA